MRKIERLLLGGVFSALLCAGTAWAADEAAKKVPDFMASGMGWNSAGGLTVVPGSPSPVVQDPKVKFVPNNVGGQPTWRYADLNNPNLTQFAKDSLKKTNEAVLAGKPMWSPSARCRATGPAFLLTPAQPLFFVQTANEVIMLHQHDNDARHIYLDVPHSENPEPSWYGESVGHYEGDTLVIDTVGTRTDRPFPMLDLYGTPYTKALHVVERYRLIDYEAAQEGLQRDAKENQRVPGDLDPAYRGKFLQVTFTVEDEGVFTMPWTATITYRPARDPWQETICAENTHEYYYNKEAEVPTANKPDF
jgi:hypothetical protein